ncbi:hypothetical protein GCM10009765_15850 [Fodinicola feengrottensis]|uniref:HTH tetR-type domain-containing protein n=1 Tax=Fodinicola feengrottensis TaxID=435914 RepID=A0ABN2G8N9_9ACTN
MAVNTCDALVEAAAKLLDGGGVAAATLREVGHRAGVSHNAPYRHFPDKEALLAAVAARELTNRNAVDCSMINYKLSARTAPHVTPAPPEPFRRGTPVECGTKPHTRRRERENSPLSAQKTRPAEPSSGRA